MINAEDYPIMPERDGPRALLTNREIDVVVGEEDVDDNVRRTLLNRIVKKVEILGKDVELLRQYRPELAREVVDTVAKPGEKDRLERAETDIRTLAFRLNRIEDHLGIVPKTEVADLAVQTGVNLRIGDDGEAEPGTDFESTTVEDETDIDSTNTQSEDTHGNKTDNDHD